MISCNSQLSEENFRSGGGVRPDFEGGQTPLKIRLGKKPGKPIGHKKIEYELIKLDMLSKMEENSTVDGTLLKKNKIITRRNKRRKLFKVLANGNLSVSGLTVRAHSFSKSAKQSIERMNGTCVLLSKTRHLSKDDIIDQALTHTMRNVSLDQALEEFVLKTREKWQMNKTIHPIRKFKLSRKQLRFVRKFKLRTKKNAEISNLVASNATAKLNDMFYNLMF